MNCSGYWETKSFVRVGGNKEITSDFRVICATNRDLKTMVKSGTFREDLFYRLNVVNIAIPPLRGKS
ncbi:MAG: sigma 54-interacting transcriptional regulator [Bacteroidales bacterium]